jgi:hypothetical protein
VIILEEYTITKALSELKLLEKRIDKSIGGLTIISSKKGDNGKVSDKYSYEEFKTNAYADLQSVNDLIDRRYKILCAIIKSNSVTTIKVNGTEMTVADGISMKTQIEQKGRLLKKLRMHNEMINNHILNKNFTVNASLERMLTGFSSDKGTNKDDLKSVSETYLSMHELKLVDPMNIGILIKDLDYEIDTFTSNIDYILSESNSITKIQI